MTFDAKKVYEQYYGLRVIENAFRVIKGTLEMRPVFHFSPRRIEAHVLYLLCDLQVYKELERILKTYGINQSVDKVLAIAKTITTIKINLPVSGNTLTKTMPYQTTPIYSRLIAVLEGLHTYTT